MMNTNKRECHTRYRYNVWSEEFVMIQVDYPRIDRRSDHIIPGSFGNQRIGRPSPAPFKRSSGYLQ